MDQAPELHSAADPASEAWRANEAAHRALGEELRAKLAAARLGGGEKARARHTARGKLLPRDRVDTLLDPGSPFLELAPLAADGMYDGQAPAAGVIAGIGRVSGRECVIVANDATVKGGTYYPMTVKKHLRAQEVALENRLPCVYLVDSGGAFLPMQDEVFPDREHFGRIFYNQARMSGAGIPQIAAVLGSCTAGGAYVPAMSDEAVIVRGQGTIFLGGPPLVKAATGEVVTAEELGGGEVHARVSGVTDHLAEDDAHALRIVRTIVSTLPARGPLPWSVRAGRRAEAWTRRAVRRGAGRLAHPVRRTRGHRARGGRLAVRRVQGGVRADAGHRLRPDPRPPGRASSRTTASCSPSRPRRAPTSSSCATSAASRCCSCRTSRASWSAGTTRPGGIAKHGAKMVTAVACTRVPKLTVVIGGSYGAGNYSMCGRAYCAALPVDVAERQDLGHGRRAGRLRPRDRQARPVGGARRGLAARRTRRRSGPRSARSTSEQGNAYYATARLWDDGVIDPLETRQVLGLALTACANAPLPPRIRGARLRRLPDVRGT